MKIFWQGLGLGARLFGVLRRAYLIRVYLPLVRNGQDMGKLSARLVNADWRETQIILQAMGARIDPTAYVESHLFIHNAHANYAHLHVGAHCYIGRNCFIDLSAPVTLLENVTLAPRVMVLTHFDAGHSAAQQFLPRSSQSVCVERGVYIGAGALIMPGVTVGADSFVAAGAVVTRDVAPGVVVGGVPAHFIKPLTELAPKER